MPFEGTVTIINNSGKIISTGRQLLNIFKEAKATYNDRKHVMNQARAAKTPAPLRRSHTYAAPSRATYEVEEEEDEEDDEVPELNNTLEYGDEFNPVPRPQARLYIEDDNRSFVSRRSHRSHRSHTSRSSRSTASSSKHSTVSGTSQLTKSNLRALTEVSSAAPSKASDAYRRPYAETAPRDMQVSRAVLTQVTSEYSDGPADDSRSAALIQRQAMHVTRYDDDDDLAYGSVPSDLAERHDLKEWEEPSSPVEEDPAVLQKIMEDEKEAKNLIRSIENLLDEAQCVHHTASSIIEHLQGNPEAAAAVALTLAELSSILGKLSPGILGLIKGGSPAVFALLASPQFLIGATAAVGVTVVMFGGWKIIKKLQGETVQKTPMAMAATPKPGIARSMTMPVQSPSSPNSLVGSQPHEALVLDDASEISSIESWRRGVPIFSDDEAEMELISPHAVRQHRRSHSGSGSSKFLAEVEPCDSVSQIGMPRPPRSHRSSAMSSVSKTSSSASSRSSSSKKSSRDAPSTVSRSKSLSVAQSRGPSKLSSSMTPSTVSSAKSSSVSGMSSSKSTKASSVASSKVPSRTSSKTGSVVSPSSSSSKHRDDKKEKRDKDDARSSASSSKSKSVVSTSTKSVASTSSKSSTVPKKEEKKEKEKKEKKGGLLKSIFQKKKTDYAQSAVVA
ncbi:hypothetical protein TD95_000830 [Thielaviopsis punctulata]|uniref:Uncharacterized protein n=1 Tax=Thielaviopsis punctulata TaxID=72032 RepID=A0A0F4ZLB0_9PEZI|nr:hypothetical protein TD95_000830 [Thielaviopsis punctulata]